MTVVIGIDLGGTKIAGVLLDVETETILTRATIPTDAKTGPDSVLRRIAEHCRALCARGGVALEEVAAVGVGVPAVLDYEAGCTLLLPNIPGDWYRKPVQTLLGGLLDRPVWLINDARAFTLAEAVLGAGRGYPVVVAMTLGTGIGGGVAIEGRLHMGLGGNAGEFGHTTVDLNGLPDGTGTPGAIEAAGSGPAIAAAGIKAVMQGVNTRIGEIVGHDLNRITPQVIAQAAAEGDQVALGILNHAGRVIGAGLGNIVTILSPHCIVIGGGMSALGEWILAPVRESLRIYNRTVDLDQLKIVQAELGDEAGAIGAALWASQRR